MNEANNLQPLGAGAVLGKQAFWSRLGRIAQLGLGGVIAGCFLGGYLGAFLGLLYGAWAGEFAVALDGALLGGGFLAAGGALYGIVLGITEKPDPESPNTLPASSSTRSMEMPRQQVP